VIAALPDPRSKELTMQHDVSDSPPWYRSRAGVVALCFAAIAGFFLVTEHAAHVFGVLPYLLILACPLMHLFMHHGHHGGHDAHGGADDRRGGERQ
jgi:hypothetical protein